MAIAQGGVESGWGTSFAPYGQRLVWPDPDGWSAQRRGAVEAGSGMPQPFSSVSEATEASSPNLNNASGLRALPQFPRGMRERGEQLRRHRPDRHAVALFRARPEYV